MSWIADSTTGIRSKREEGKKQKKKEKQVFLLLTIGFKWRCVYLGVCFFLLLLWDLDFPAHALQKGTCALRCSTLL